MKNCLFACALAAVCNVLTGCIDPLLISSKYNAPNEQLALFKAADMVDRDEFKIDMAAFVSSQLNSIEKAIGDKAVGQARAALCKQDTLLQTSEIDQLASLGSLPQALSRDRAFIVSLQTASASQAQRLAAFANGGNSKLSFADIENFRRAIADASAIPPRGVTFKGVADVQDAGAQRFFSSLFTSGDKDAAKRPVLAYLGAYYRGKFVDRFGLALEKPSFKDGVQDGTIANFTRLILEAGIDTIKPHEAALKDVAGKAWLPTGKQPTFASVYEKVDGTSVNASKTGALGISEKEYKLVVAGANAMADQGLTLFSGFLQFLSSIDVGIVVAPNIAIGSNATLKSVGEALIETTIRRTAERGLYCLMDKYDFDAVAEVLQ